MNSTDTIEMLNNYLKRNQTSRKKCIDKNRKGMLIKYKPL